MSFGQCHAEEIYVRVKTGERFFGIDYIGRDGNTPMDLFSELAHGTVVHEDEWLKNYPPEAEPNPEIRKARIKAATELEDNKEEYNEPEQQTIQDNRTPLRHEGNMSVRPDRSAHCSAQTQQETSKREVRYMCGLIFAAIVASLLWLLYY